MTDINSSARQLLEQIGLKELAGDPPDIVAQYDMLVDRVAEHLRQVANEARETTNPCNKIFDHKWLSPDCGETGCKSLLLAHRAERAEELADKYKWQVRDTCTRAEKAESALASLRALLAEAGDALDRDQTAIKEMLRYLEGGETKGSYDGKPERRRLRFAQSTSEVALAAIQTALRDASPTKE